MNDERKPFTLPWWRVECKMPEELEVLLNSYQRHPEWFTEMDKINLEVSINQWRNSQNLGRIAI